MHVCMHVLYHAYKARKSLSLACSTAMGEHQKAEIDSRPQDRNALTRNEEEGSDTCAGHRRQNHSSSESVTVTVSS